MYTSIPLNQFVNIMYINCLNKYVYKVDLEVTWYVTGTDHHIILCGVTTVRLVSSGSYDNSATVSLRMADENDRSPAATICPIPDF